MPRPAVLYNRRKWQLIGKSQWCRNAMLQLQHTPPPQSTTPGLHPVSIHQMASPVRGSKHPITAYYSVYRPRKDERLAGCCVTFSWHIAVGPLQKGGGGPRPVQYCDRGSGALWWRRFVTKVRWLTWLTCWPAWRRESASWSDYARHVTSADALSSMTSRSSRATSSRCLLAGK